MPNSRCACRRRGALPAARLAAPRLPARLAKASRTLGRVLRPVQQIGARGFDPARYEVVGGYALQLWADGHSTGIYSFDLHRLALLP